MGTEGPNPRALVPLPGVIALDLEALSDDTGTLVVAPGAKRPEMAEQADVANASEQADVANASEAPPPPPNCAALQSSAERSPLSQRRLG